MKKKLLFAAIILLGLTSCIEKNRPTASGTSNQSDIVVETDTETIKEVYAISTSLDGVVINGVRWATRNVNTPGTFAQNPEDAGMFFQWNRKKAWDSTSGEVENWDNSPATGTEWEAQNDPCPAGWRLPTEAELHSLRDAGSELASLNGMPGYLFGVAPYQLFLPATGWRMHGNGALSGVDEWGFYWSGTENGTAYAMCLIFNNDFSFVEIGTRAWGFSVRCVAD